MARRKASGAVAHGDRAVFLGLGPRGQHLDILCVHGQFATVRFEDGRGMLVLTRDCHPIPRRPPPMW